MENIIIIGIVALAVLGASVYIIKEKRKGIKCIGCPNADICRAKACGTGACRLSQNGQKCNTENA